MRKIIVHYEHDNTLENETFKFNTELEAAVHLIRRAPFYMAIDANRRKTIRRRLIERRLGGSNSDRRRLHKERRKS